PGGVRAGLHLRADHPAGGCRRAPGGQELAGPAGAADPLHRRVHRSRLPGAHHARAVEHGDAAGRAVARDEDRPAVLLPALEHLGAAVRQRRQPQPLPRPARADPVALGAELPSHQDPRGGGEVTDSVRASTADHPRTRHRLQLPRDTEPRDVLTMVSNVHPQVSEGEDGTLELGDGVQLVPDRAPRGAGRWTVETPRIREDPAPAWMTDSHGYGRAFPEGLPFGVERQALDLAWSLGRRLYGAVVTDDGERLEPHPFHVRDLTVVSPHALAPESLALLLAPVEPDAELDEAPEDAVRTGYSATIPLPDGDAISLRVGRSA